MSRKKVWKNQEIPVKIFLMAMKQFLLNLFFPLYCINCQGEENYLCQDCFSLIDIQTFQYCPFCSPAKIVFDGKTCYSCRKNKKLTGLFCAASYQNFIIKKLISQFKYEPYVKELAKPLAYLIIQHFQSLDYPSAFFKDRTGFIFVPVPLHKKRLKWRGFNQAEEIARHLSLCFKIPLISDVLLKTKETRPQMELTAEVRKENIKSAFVCQNKNLIKEKKILLVDDVFTTGSTMEECARVLKNSGAKEVWGVAVARE